jgi:hypothetical protein
VSYLHARPDLRRGNFGCGPGCPCIECRARGGTLFMGEPGASHCYDAFAMRVAGYAAARSDITRCRARPVEGHQHTCR